MTEPEHSARLDWQQTERSLALDDAFELISDWLMERSLSDAELSDTVSVLAGRLAASGVAIERMKISRIVMHPILGVVDVTWNAGTPGVAWDVISRERAIAEMTPNSPFGEVQKAGRLIARLDDPNTAQKYRVFQDLAAAGMTGYAAFKHQFGAGPTVLPGIPDSPVGAIISFATRRFSGFSEVELAGLEKLAVPLAVCLRVATERFLMTELLETYLGRISARHVLNGQVARGDCQTIDCALLYSDMRESTEFASVLVPEAYLETLNQYFDCVARAVLDHGGEVLKFTGDGILAIFPFDEMAQPQEATCTAALAAAREAFARAMVVNNRRKASGEGVFDFGVALHVGNVLYGNIGSEKRLDFTATGRSVALASRCEAMTRILGSQIVASETFCNFISETGLDLGSHDLRGFEHAVSLTGFSIGSH